MTKSTIFIDEVTIPEGSVVSREPEHELADRILHLVEDKLHAAVVNAAKERFVIRHPHSGRVLDVSAAGVANGTKVQLWDANRTKAQEWKFDEDGLIVNPRSGKCLTAHGYECGGSPSLVIWEPYNNGDDKEQAWTYTADGMLIHKATGKALTGTSDNRLVIGDRNWHKDMPQQWQLVPLSLMK
jgi:Ricin-type beta-trefoil lectin domain